MSFGCTPCPKCAKLVIVLDNDDWSRAQYICTCGTAFMFKIGEDEEES